SSAQSSQPSSKCACSETVHTPALSKHCIDPTTRKFLTSSVKEPIPLEFDRPARSSRRRAERREHRIRHPQRASVGGHRRQAPQALAGAQRVGRSWWRSSAQGVVECTATHPTRPVRGIGVSSPLDASHRLRQNASRRQFRLRPEAGRGCTSSPHLSTSVERAERSRAGADHRPWRRRRS
ncbi:MAG: hypothetical protein QOD88_265, partial [Mycobacterium sp.]|nr:hypothetical protein [Mycobacterium sp.]